MPGPDCSVSVVTPVLSCDGDACRRRGFVPQRWPRLRAWTAVGRHWVVLAAVLFGCAWAQDAPASGVLATGRSGDVRSVELRAPLNTVVRAEHVPVHPRRIEMELVVPIDAPADLGVGVFLDDGHGRWFQGPVTRPLSPGRQQVSWDVGDQALLVCEPDRAAWTSYARSGIADAGVFLWSAQASRAAIQVVRLVVIGDQAGPDAVAPASGADIRRLCDLRIDGVDSQAGIMRGRTGARWTVNVRPDPFPRQPFDLAQFSLSALITTPDGQQLRIDGFFRQPLDLIDQGDRELGVPTGAPSFELRFRPELPGAYTVRLDGRWAGAAEPVSLTLPDLIVTGEPWDDYARVDPADPRFFSTGDRIGRRTFYWPIGLNLHSVWDLRTRGCCQTILTPGRLWKAYEAYLRRFAAAGGTAVEIWLCSWGLALEWRGEWTEFHGVGCYSDQNSERLDRVLDLASSLGIRVNLVINNHGQASTNADREWDANPWNIANGGPIDQAAHFFTDQAALEGQERLRRYIIARWADHPAILGWKLWSEQNLTAGGASLPTWHVQAAERWQALDHYGHGVTTHWAGDYRSPDKMVVVQPGLNYLCIDAYHGRDSLLAQLLWDGSNAHDNLARFGKPVLVTEYGGTPGAGPQPQIIAEHHSGHFAALVSGCSGSPMLWWFEWVDQRNQWSPYTAIARFIAGEDLRGRDASAVVLEASGGQGALWARAWKRPGRLLGYVLDRDWGQLGEVERTQEHVVIAIGTGIPAGPVSVTWWDAETGLPQPRLVIAHLDGPLDLAVPTFAHHIAFKLAYDWEESAIPH
jgi:hypothetical protein